jgi:GNAT superfamily N-acetyltransferase
MWEAIGGGFSPKELDRHDRAYRGWLRSRLASGSAGAVVAWEGSRAVGSGLVWLREDQPRPGTTRLKMPYILSIFTVPDRRGSGIATGVTRWLVAWARTRGYQRVLLHASRFGRGVYRKLGFDRTWEMRLGGSFRHGPERKTPADAHPLGERRRPRRSRSSPARRRATAKRARRS